MGFYTLVDESGTDQDDLPWLSEYLELNPKGQDGVSYLVNYVKASKKGWILATDEFNCWVWRKSKPGEALQQGLTDSVSKEVYPHLAVMVKPKSKSQFLVGFVDDAMACYEWNGEDMIYSLSAQKSLPLSNPLELVGETQVEPEPKKSRRAS